MDAKIFTEESHRALAHIDEVLGGLEHEELDVELAGDVLSLDFESGPTFVINAHSAAGQVWMAAGTTAWHFDFTADGGWVAGKTGDELMATVARVVSEALGQQIEL